MSCIWQVLKSRDIHPSVCLVLSSQALEDFGSSLPTLVLCREMNESSFLLCILNYSNLINKASMEADRSLWCFFVERRDSSGSVSPTATNQEENDEICLYHIRKSCSFQGKLAETLHPCAGGITVSHSWSSALRPS